MQKSPKSSQSVHHRTTLSGYIFGTKAYIDNRKKNLLNSNTSPTCPYNMVKFGPLAAEIILLVWGTPANFNGFRILAALLHGTLVVGISQTAALNRGRHLYSAGQPSHWALAHILVVSVAVITSFYFTYTYIDYASKAANIHTQLHVQVVSKNLTSNGFLTYSCE